jgi:hypothetical protein
LAVKVNGKEATGVVEQERIDSGDEIVRTRAPDAILASKMDFDHFISVTVMNDWFGHSPQRTCGFPHTPRNHSFAIGYRLRPTSLPESAVARCVVVRLWW